MPAHGEEQSEAASCAWSSVRIGDDAPEWLSEGEKATTKEVAAVAEDEDDEEG